MCKCFEHINPKKSGEGCWLKVRPANVFDGEKLVCSSGKCSKSLTNTHGTNQWIWVFFPKDGSSRSEHSKIGTHPGWYPKGSPDVIEV